MLQTNIEQTTGTQGLGPYLLETPTNPLRISFVQGMGTNAKVWYRCESLEGVTPVQWEEGWGTVTSGSPDVLTRQGVSRSSNNNGFVVWEFGVKRIGCIEPAEQALFGGPGSVPVATNTANAPKIVHTPPMRVVQPGMTVAFVASNTNTGPMTLTVDSLSEVPLRTAQNLEIPANAIQAGDTVIAKRVNNVWQWINASNAKMITLVSPPITANPVWIDFPLPAEGDITDYMLANIAPLTDAPLLFRASINNNTNRVETNTYLHNFIGTLGIGTQGQENFARCSYDVKAGVGLLHGTIRVTVHPNQVQWTAQTSGHSPVGGGWQHHSLKISGVVPTTSRANGIGFAFVSSSFANSGHIIGRTHLR